MGEVIHTIRVTIRQGERGVRQAVFQGFEDQPLEFGLHGGYKEFYKVTPDRDRLTTVDHLAAALAG